MISLLHYVCTFEMRSQGFPQDKILTGHFININDAFININQEALSAVAFVVLLEAAA